MYYPPLSLILAFKFQPDVQHLSSIALAPPCKVLQQMTRSLAGTKPHTRAISHPEEGGGDDGGRRLAARTAHTTTTPATPATPATAFKIGGTTADYTDYAVGGVKCLPNTPARNCWTMERWEGVLQWAKKVDARIIFTLNGMRGTCDNSVTFPSLTPSLFLAF